MSRQIDEWKGVAHDLDLAETLAGTIDEEKPRSDFSTILFRPGIGLAFGIKSRSSFKGVSRLLNLQQKVVRPES